MSKRILLFLMVVLTCSMVTVGCGGDDGSDGTSVSVDDVINDPGFGDAIDDAIGDNTDSVEQIASKVDSESCSVCHNGSAEFDGAAHQAIYTQYTDTGQYSATITGVTRADNGGKADLEITFQILKDAVAGDWIADFTSSTFKVAQYDSTENSVGEGFVASLSNPVYNGGAQEYTVTATATDLDPTMTDYFGYVQLLKDKLAIADNPGGYFGMYDEVINEVYAVGAAAADDSAAVASGCESCHGDPYRKHGNIQADAGGLDFLVCKTCHFHDKTGGHESWQLIVDNPAKAGLYYKDGDGDIESQMTTAELAQYGYTANLMNDVHMSHAMEFGYPQSMRNCATCHDGKLSVVLADANFQYETCISCHPVTGGTDTADADGNYTSDTTTYALTTLANAGYPNHSNILNASTDCTTCHSAAGGMPTFAEIHTGGYDPAIYTTTGDKYAEDVTVTIDSVALSGTSLTIAFSAASTIAGVDAADIVPSVYVAAYGYDTKDFIISNHGRDADGNRLGEYTFGGDANPYFTNATASGASWSVTYDISAFDTDSMVTDGVIKRVEVAVAPSLEVGDVTVGLNAVSTTFNLEDAAVEAGFFGHDIADANSCNTCHDQLATTFHSPDRGGSITVCRMCHVTTSGGSHLEMQSRSIDSYVHAIHTFQPFDTDDIDFSDPFEQMEYDHHIGSTYPMFTTTNCESCHNSDKYNVPDQSKSLPGLLSAAGEWSMDRDIGAVPSYVNGPASRACGSCHRSEFINADEAGKLASFNAHTKTFGFLEENQDGLLNAVIDAVMAKFQ